MNDEIGYAILAVGLLFVIAAMFSLGRGRKRRAETQTTARDHVERARQKQGVRDELEALMVDINRMAKDMGAQLDAKIVRIEQANREADERIARLEALVQSTGSADSAAAASFAALSGPQPAEQQAAAAAVPADVQALQTEADPLTREVYTLADSGLGAVDIAQKLGEHVGKIELILALRSG